jgi:hypothetical protein
MIKTLIRRIIKLRNTVLFKTFPRDLHRLRRWSSKTNMFFGMNHDFMRACIVLKVIDALGIDVFVETGTHQGRTCFLIAAQTNLPIFSSEVNQKYMRVARLFLKCFGSRVHLSHLDSVQFLNSLLTQKRFRCPLFYLDAHWYSKLPLIEELQEILMYVDNFIIIIDDFRVPADSKFGFDRYGETALEWQLIQKVLVDSGRSMAAFFPAYPSSLEVGDGRGWILIASLDNKGRICEVVPPDLLELHTVIDRSTRLLPSPLAAHS